MRPEARVRARIAGTATPIQAQLHPPCVRLYRMPFWSIRTQVSAVVVAGAPQERVRREHRGLTHSAHVRLKGAMANARPTTRRSRIAAPPQRR